MARSRTAAPGRRAGERSISAAILDLVSSIPATTERSSADPAARGRAIAVRASIQAASAAGVLALPPGPLGWVTILPEIVGVWRIQAQMVADIAGAYGKTAVLSREQMLYCLFRHSAAQVVRDLVVRVGARLLIRRASLKAIQTIAAKVGLRITQRAIGKAATRLVPFLGAVGVAGYAWYDTGSVAKTAMDLFSKEIELE
jgi:hypothetical protein